LGLIYLKNADAQQAALGNTAVTTGDTRTMMQIRVDDLNAHGGIGGRKVVPVYHGIDATSTQTAAQVAEAACADFTQDHHVFATVGSSNPDFLTCMRKAGSVAVLGGNSLVGETSAQYMQHPADFDVISLSIDRLAADLVPVLVRTHYFDPWNTASGAPGVGKARVGIIVPDRPEFHSGVAVLLAALKSAGITVAAQDVAYFTWPQSTGEDAQAVADIQAYVLKFRANGVTHVLPLEQNAMVFFGAAADKQGYRPRYGLNSATAAQQYVGSLLPASQLNGAVGLGFFPNTDLSSADNPETGPYSNPARRQCLDLMRRHGQTFRDTSAEANALTLCDSFSSLRSLLQSIPRATPWNQGTFSQALDHIGGLPSANLTSVRYGPGKRDAVSVGWVWRFQADCACLRYSGARFDLP
jgi:ABC-type branched-subunit amino acid transport system substrate-binding protein